MADYHRAIDVLHTFSCTTLHQYMELYMKTDVVHLADLFEEFRGVPAELRPRPSALRELAAVELGRHAPTHKVHAGPHF